MPAPRRSEREVARDLRLARAERGVAALRRAALAAEQEFGAELDAMPAARRESACNLVHYLAVRRLDVRQLQEDLTRLGLSSLGRMEAHVMASLQAVLVALRTLRGERPGRGLGAAPPVTFDTGAALLAEHANAMLGVAPAGHATRIMVTMPGTAADDPQLIRDLVEAGMQVMRINCAHDEPAVWERMVSRLRRAERRTGKRCLVSFDLAGPKIRTGPMPAGPQVLKWRPLRDDLGRTTVPAHVRLLAGSVPALPEAPTVPVTGPLLPKAKPGDTVTFVDTRERKRTLRVTAARAGECACECDTTAYVVPGTPLTLRRKGRALAKGQVGALPAVERALVLRVGDLLDIVRGDGPGREAVHDEGGRVATPAAVSCALPELFTGVRVGEPMLFDDGRIRGIVRGVVQDRVRVEVTAVAGTAAKLGAEKGINVPESALALPALTAKDVADLAVVRRHADMVALSFVQRPEDVEDLVRALAAHRGRRPHIVLKIETQAAFNRLPRLLLAAMRHPPLAVMVARGDLGVEVGFERLSEVQEEILWLCEAAHVPVIWATQVLESLAKGGLPSRAEVTDAAMGSRAECVMLNKGPYIRETLRFLIDVLARMEEHQHKKSARLRKLRVSEAGAPPPAVAARRATAPSAAPTAPAAPRSRARASRAAPRVPAAR